MRSDSRVPKFSLHVLQYNSYVWRNQDLGWELFADLRFHQLLSERYHQRSTEMWAQLFLVQTDVLLPIRTLFRIDGKKKNGDLEGCTYFKSSPSSRRFGPGWQGLRYVDRYWDKSVTKVCRLKVLPRKQLNANRITGSHVRIINLVHVPSTRFTFACRTWQPP